MILTSDSAVLLVRAIWAVLDTIAQKFFCDALFAVVTLEFFLCTLHRLTWFAMAFEFAVDAGTCLAVFLNKCSRTVGRTILIKARAFTGRLTLAIVIEESIRAETSFDALGTFAEGIGDTSPWLACCWAGRAARAVHFPLFAHDRAKPL